MKAKTAKTPKNLKPIKQGYDKDLGGFSWMKDQSLAPFSGLEGNAIYNAKPSKFFKK